MISHTWKRLGEYRATLQVKRRASTITSSWDPSHPKTPALAMEAIGIHTKLIENPLPNLKITVAQDLTLAEAILRTRQA